MAAMQKNTLKYSAVVFLGGASYGVMAAYIDEHESRFKVGPICGVLSESLDCGFLTPRGCRMFRTRPVSRMRAGHEALARDILQIHSDFFMAVYGYGKMHAQLVAQGWDPAEVGRDQVMNIMRELGINVNFNEIGRASCRERVSSPV